MKKVILIIILVLNNLSIFCQNESWNILTIGRDIYSINFLTNNKCLMLAGDYSYFSSNSGDYWSLPRKNNSTAGYSGGAYFNYPDQTSFVDSLFGWTVVYDNTVKKTTNGGLNWVVINTNLTYHYFTCVNFFDRLNGYLAGKTNLNKGFIAKTTNAGNNWTLVVNTLPSVPSTFTMLNTQKGFTNLNSDTIAVTNDGWNSFDFKKVGSGQGIQRIFFLDSLNGFVLGNIDFISRTTNGGINWSVNQVNLGNTVNMYFLNLQTGWVTSTMQRIYKTTNSGINWTRQCFNGNNSNDVYNDIVFKNENTGYACGSKGAFLKTTNSGANWINLFNIPATLIKTIDFINLNTGWIGGAYGLHKSTNRGYNWTNISSFNTININDIKFIDEFTGYLTSENTLYKTSNSGINWMNVISLSYNLNKINLINQNVAYICCDSGKVLKTTNSGLNWIPLETGVISYLYDMNFINELNGFITTGTGLVIKTTNGGGSWSLQYPYDQKIYRAVHFINAATGFIAGESTYSQPPFPPSFIKVLLKTTNGGENWTLQYTQSNTGYNKFTDLFFINENTGWVLSDNTGVGVISRTLNGGADLSTVFGPIGNGFETNGFKCIKYINENNLLAAGDNGLIVSSIPPIGIIKLNSETPQHFILAQNYPNPFNPQTKIKFAVPSNVKRETSNVKLIIYDLLGREVTTLVNEEFKPGTYEADWDGSNFSSGVYFYKIISGDFVETKKMVLMK